MTFTVEMLFKGKGDVLSESVEHEMARDGWTDDDVRAVLHTWR